MAMSNAWYRAQYRNFDAEKKRTKGNFKESLPIQFLETMHWPRYYFADQLVTIHNRQDFVNLLSNQSLSRNVAFVKLPNFVPANGLVRSIIETANRATLDVESFGQGFLVMSVTPHKYWRITMDGRSVPAVIINTVTGHELPGAQFLANLLVKNGVKAEVIESAPGRGNVYARLKGRRAGEGLLLLNHIDVMPAPPEHWKRPPFAAEIFLNQVWGRGSLDMKSIGLCELDAFLTVARTHRPLERDLIFLGVARSEEHTSELQSHSDLVCRLLLEK